MADRALGNEAAMRLAPSGIDPRAKSESGWWAAPCRQAVGPCLRFAPARGSLPPSACDGLPPLIAAGLVGLHVPGLHYPSSPGHIHFRALNLKALAELDLRLSTSFFNIALRRISGSFRRS